MEEEDRGVVRKQRDRGTVLRTLQKGTGNKKYRSKRARVERVGNDERGDVHG